ncbi:MAG TPA: alpha-2-macroglobulin, partial [Ginsengibacter sp.]
MRIRYFLFAAFSFILLSFCFSSLCAQQKTQDYATQWKKIDALVTKGLTKSALAEVAKIYTAAKKDNNDPQVIKALLYKITLKQNIEEDAAVKSIDSLTIEIASAKEPAKSILESITAQMYWNYFQQNRYQLYQRTNTVNFDKKDIATWTADDLHKKIGELFVASVKDKNLLQQTKLDQFDAILIKGNVRYLRPTLYDLLAHEALAYFKSDEQDITKPAYAFEIKDAKAFAPAAEFIEQKFITTDSASLHQKALLIFQNLLEFHINDNKPDALIDADIERINFVNQYGVMNNKDSLYMDALKNVAEKYADNPLSAQPSFLIAQTIYNNASQATKNNDTVSSSTVKQAKQMLDEIAKKFPESEGGINARNLINQIIHPEIKLTTEKVNVPELPFRTLVTYKNFNSVYFRLIELTPQLKKDIAGNYDNEKVFLKLTTQQGLKNWKQDLPATDDYLSHSTEVKIDALPVGEYALLGSATADFSLSRNPLTVQYFYVSNISFINSGLQYFVLDRTSGQPLDGAKVQIWKQQYDYSDRSNKLQKGELVTADKNGYLKLSVPEKNNNNYIRLDISYKKDHLFMDDAQYVYSYYNSDEDDEDYDDQKDYDKTKAKIFLFT